MIRGIVLRGQVAVEFGKQGNAQVRETSVLAMGALVLAGCVPADRWGYYVPSSETPGDVVMVNPLALAFGGLELTWETTYWRGRKQRKNAGNSMNLTLEYVFLDSPQGSMEGYGMLLMWKGYPGKKAPAGAFGGLGAGWIGGLYKDSIDPANNRGAMALCFVAMGGYKFMEGSFALEIGAGIDVVDVFEAYGTQGLEEMSGVGPYLELAIGLAF